MIVSLLRTLSNVAGCYTSVRARVRDEADGYSASSDYWIRCLYDGEKGDPEDVEKGFLKGDLLVRVRFSTTATIPNISY